MSKSPSAPIKIPIRIVIPPPPVAGAVFGIATDELEGVGVEVLVGKGVGVFVRVDVGVGVDVLVDVTVGEAGVLET